MYHWLQLMKDLSFFLKKYNKIFIEGNKNCKFFTISSIKYKFRKWAKRLIKEWAKRLRVGGRNDSRNGGRNDSGAKRLRAKRLRANGKVDETTRYRPELGYRRTRACELSKATSCQGNMRRHPSKRADIK